MKTSSLYFPTAKEIPSEAEVVSHQLMLKSGMIKKLASGVYSWLPLGLKVLRKVEKIVREEMESVGAQEILMPALQPAEIWQQSGRWDKYGPELLRLKDRAGRNFCLGPTHEEVIVEMLKGQLTTYKKLPLILYQIQTKFRDEMRPRFGIMRAREFLMKDAYSLHATQESLDDTYEAMHEAYCKIFQKLGLEFKAVKADSGSIGGNFSTEFQVLAPNGEDVVVYSEGASYAANIEMASCLPRDNKGEFIKALFFSEALVLIQDHFELNLTKLEKFVAYKPLQQHKFPISELESFLQQYAEQAKIILDRDLAFNFNLAGGDFQVEELRNVEIGDLDKEGNPLKLCRGIEVGHIFKLQDKYSKAMGFNFTSKEQKLTSTLMGCYGIGISRIVAAAIEQSHDDEGIIWPLSLAPFRLTIVPVNYNKDTEVKARADQLYHSAQQNGVEVLLEDREIGFGAMLKDQELIGTPFVVIVSSAGLKKDQLELLCRKTKEQKFIPLEEVLANI